LSAPIACATCAIGSACAGPATATDPAAATASATAAAAPSRHELLLLHVLLLLLLSSAAGNCVLLLLLLLLLLFIRLERLLGHAIGVSWSVCFCKKTIERQDNKTSELSNTQATCNKQQK
jgi:hypothetical protein